MYVSLGSRSSRAGRAVTALALSAALLAACGHRAPARADGVTQDAVDLVTGSGTWPSTESVLARANDMLTAKCMARRGLQFTARADPVPDNADEDSVVGLARRRREGYGLAVGRNVRPAQDVAVSAMPPASREHYLAVLFGDPAGRVAVTLPGGASASLPGEGCQFEAIRTLAGDVQSWGAITYAPQYYSNQLAPRVGDVREYQQALRNWRSCMAAKGERHTDPASAQRSVQATYQARGLTAAARQLEIRTAVDDGICALDAHLPRAALHARQHLVRGLPHDAQQYLNQISTMRARILAAAERLLTGGASSAPTGVGR